MPQAGASRTGHQRSFYPTQELVSASKGFAATTACNFEPVLCFAHPFLYQRRSCLPGSFSKLVTSPAWILLSAAFSSAPKGFLEGSAAFLQQIQLHECTFKFLTACHPVLCYVAAS